MDKIINKMKQIKAVAIQQVGHDQATQMLAPFTAILIPITSMLGVTMKGKREASWQEKCITMINETNEQETMENEEEEEGDAVPTSTTEFESKRVSRMSRKDTYHFKPNHQSIKQLSESPK